MLAIRRDGPVTETQPNLLPCNIRHNGPAPISSRHWPVSSSNDGSRTAYFRGRKLAGKEVKLPAHYQGLILQPTDEIIHLSPESVVQQEEQGEDNETVPQLTAKVLEQTGVFESMTIWAHESLPSEDDDHIRAIQEWISFAESVSQRIQRAASWY